MENSVKPTHEPEGALHSPGPSGRQGKGGWRGGQSADPPPRRPEADGADHATHHARVRGQPGDREQILTYLAKHLGQ